MNRLLALLLTLTLMAALAIPGGTVSRCAATNTAVSALGSTSACCLAQAQVADAACCCLEKPAPAPLTLPTVDRHWLVDGVKAPLVTSVAILWSYAPADVPAGIWRTAPLLPFAGAPPPRERFCIILT